MRLGSRGVEDDSSQHDKADHEAKKNVYRFPVEKVRHPRFDASGNYIGANKGHDANNSVSSSLRPRGKDAKTSEKKVRLNEYYRYEVADLSEINEARRSVGLPEYCKREVDCFGCGLRFKAYHEVLSKFLKRVQFYCYDCKRGW